MFQYQCLELPFAPREDILKAIATKVARLVDEFYGEKHGGTVSLAVIDDARMQELNATYRNMDKTTDVLSFHYYDDFSDCQPDDVAGEIVFSETKLPAQAAEFGHSVEEEFYRLTVHGTIHILGFDHETDEDYEEMWAIEKVVLEELREEFGILKSEGSF